MELVHFYLKLILDGNFTLVSTYLEKRNVEIDVTYNFTNQDTPSDTDITIHGLTQRTANKFKAGKTLTMYAGFFNSDWTKNTVAHILTAKITSVSPLKNDSGDWILHLVIQDGTKVDPGKAIKVATSKKIRIKSANHSFQYRKQLGAYEKQQREARQAWLKANPKANTHQKHSRYVQTENNIKSYRTQLKGKQNRFNKEMNKKKAYRTKTVYKFISFKPGTKGSAIIKKLATKSGINISKMKLVYDRPYYNGYTARKKPLNCIRDIAKDCKTDMFYQNGRLVIMSFAKNKKVNYTCTPETGLITPPDLSDDDDAKNTYQATILFNPKITTGSIFRIEDKFSSFIDDVIVTSGSASIQAGDTPTMDINFKKLSAYKKEQAKSIKKQRSSDAKSKAKLGEKNRKAAIKKRQERSKKHGKK